MSEEGLAGLLIDLRLAGQCADLGDELTVYLLKGRSLPVEQVAGLQAGELERVVLEPVSGWIDRPLVWQPPRKGTRIAWWRLLGTSLASAFAFGGLLSIAYAWGAKDA